MNRKKKFVNRLTPRDIMLYQAKRVAIIDLACTYNVSTVTIFQWLAESGVPRLRRRGTESARRATPKAMLKNPPPETLP